MKKETIINHLKKCEVSNVLDGTENDRIFERSSDKSNNVNNVIKQTSRVAKSNIKI